jgi:tetratricopeptide (TPR) repeat protein
VTELIQQALRSFVRTVSPYKVTVQAEVASGGDSEAANALGQGRALAARNRLNKISANQRAAADWYNLGLAYEASAAVIEDYEDARRFYQEALRRDSGNLLFAQGIGRVERVLDEARRLDQQLSASR